MDPNIAGWRYYIFVEPPLILYLLAQALTSTVVTDLMVFRSCQSMEGAEKNICDILHTNSSSREALELEAKAQPHATYVLLCKSFVDGIVPAFLSFFLGPWSDKYGRKPLLVAGYGGSALSFLLWTILCTLDVDPWLYLLSSIPTALVGGFCGIILATFCYITDMTKDGDRAWHLTWIQAAISGGLLLGIFAGSAIFKKFGYVAVFGTACGCSSLATVYVIFFVPETVIRTDAQKSWHNLFDVSLVKDTFTTCTKKRDGFNRVIAWSCILCLTLNVLVMEGDLSVGYLFSSAKFGWNVGDYAFYQETSVFLSIVGTLLGAKFFRTFVDQNLLDMGIAIFASTSFFAGAMTKALVAKPWHLFLSTSLAMCGGLLSPVLRAILSKSGPPQDAGKIFSLTTSMEALVPLVAAPIYTLVYTHNMPPIYPAPVFLVSSGIFAGIIVLLILTERQISKSRNSRYIAINEEIETSN